MKVLMMANYPADPNRIHGGVQAAVLNLVQALANIDELDLHVLTFARPAAAPIGPYHARSKKAGRAAKAPGEVTVHHITSFPRFERLKFYRGYQRLLDERLAEIQPDLLHVQEAVEDAWVALRSGYPTVVTVHGVRGEEGKHYTGLGRKLRYLFDGLLIERSNLRRVRHLIAISRYVSRYFAGQTRPDLQRYEIPNAIDKRFFDLPHGNGRPVVLFAGRVTPLKGVMELARAFAGVARRYPQAELRIAGECSSEPGYVQALRNWIARQQLGANVRLLGELSQDDLLREYSQCSLLALASRQENLPVVIAQAQAAGKPVVAANVGGVSEMLGEKGERGLLAPPGDVNSLEAALLRLLGDPELRARLGQAGRRHASQHYHPDQVAQRTFQVYQRVLRLERAGA